MNCLLSCGRACFKHAKFPIISSLHPGFTRPATPLPSIYRIYHLWDQCGFWTSSHRIRKLAIVCRNSIVTKFKPNACKKDPHTWSKLQATFIPGSKSLAFAWPVSILKRTRYNETSVDILANIPHEVFKTDIPIRSKRSSNVLVRLLLWTWDHVRFVWRLTIIWLTFTPLLFLYPVTYLGDKYADLWWRLLLYACEHSGPTFIKLGQWASTRRDLFSEEFCELFSKLHRTTKVHSWFYTKRRLTKAFGERWKDILVKIEKRPVGSGCIAQVHRAYVRADMIPDESLVEDVLAEMDDMDNGQKKVDFAEGLEILGFGHVIDATDNLEEPFTDPKVRAEKKHWWDTSATDEAETSKVNQKIEKEKLTLGGPDNDSTDKQGTSKPFKFDRRLEPEGEDPLIPVAVKILHPGIYRSVSRDIQILRLMAKVMTMLFPSLKWLSLPECVEEFAGLMTQQIDLRFEAECLEQFVDNFEDVANIRFPRPVWPYCKREVLVETFEEGTPICQFIKGHVEAPPGLKELLANYGIDALLQMIFVDNFVHGDLHPGNILVQNAHQFVPEREENKLVLVDICDTVVVNVKPVVDPIRLVLLDVGITTCLSEEDRRNFKNVFTAVVLGEGEKVAELMLRHARYNKCKDVAAFKKELGDVVMKARQTTLKLGKIQVGDLLTQVFSILSKHKVKMESNFASILLAIFVLEGLGRSLDPELDLLEKAKPILLG